MWQKGEKITSKNRKTSFTHQISILLLINKFRFVTRSKQMPEPDNQDHSYMIAPISVLPDDISTMQSHCRNLKIRVRPDFLKRGEVCSEEG